jgi:hypothetical protein
LAVCPLLIFENIHSNGFFFKMSLQGPFYQNNFIQNMRKHVDSHYMLYIEKYLFRGISFE